MKKNIGNFPVKDDIEFINEDSIMELGGAKTTVNNTKKACGNLRTCGWNSDTCPRLEKCTWNN